MTEPNYWLYSLILTGGTIFVGGVVCIIYFYQLRAMRESVEKAGEAAKAARDSADALINSERAWVIVDIDQGERPTEGKPLGFICPVWNTGKTPARIIYKASHLMIIERISGSDDVPMSGLDETPKLSGTSSSDILAPAKPGQPGSLFISGHVTTSKVTRNDMERLEQKQIYLYAYGVIEYLDTFGRNRKTSFGFLWHPKIAGDLQANQWVRDGKPAYNEST